MSDTQDPSLPTAPPDFGEIPIHLGGLPPRPRSAKTAPPPKVAPVKPPEKAARKKMPRSGGRSWGRLCFMLLAAAVPLLLLCAAGGLYMLPRFIKGPLAEELGRRLGRPVAIAEASFDPLRFELRLGEITLGAPAASPEEEELARIASIEAHIQPKALLRRQIVLEDLRIDRLRAKLLRRADGSFNALPGKGASLPSWLHVQGLRLSRSTVHFFDQSSGKKHLVEHIELTLPAAGQGAEPSLSAVVNSSPLHITGQRQQEGGSLETKLSIKLDDLDPQQYLGLLPGLTEQLSVSAERADAVLEVLLQDADQGPSITGSITFSKLLAQSADCEDQPEQCIRLAAPVAHLIVRVHPLQKLCTIEELLLEEPQLDLPASQEALLVGGPLAAKAGVLLNPDEIGLTVGKLTLNKGRVRSGNKEWTEVQLDLSGFKNVKAAALTQESGEPLLSFSATSGGSVISFKGSADPAFNLSGSLSGQNMQADLLQPYLSAGEALHFAKGTVDLAGAVRLVQTEDGASIAFSASTVALRDFALQRSGKKHSPLLTGKILNGTDCSLDSGGVVCGKVVLDQADVADSSLLLPSGSTKSSPLRFTANVLELKTSAVRLPLGGAYLPLSGLNMTVQADRSLKLTAAAGKKGSVEISGTADTIKNGAALLTGTIALKNISPSLLDSFLAKDGTVRFSQGTADLSGAFRLEQGRLQLSGGTVSVRDFSLQQNKAALLSGKVLNGTDCALNNSGMVCGTVALDQADFADSGFFLQPTGRLRFSTSALDLNNSAARLLLGTTQLPLSSLNLSLNRQNNVKLEATVGGSGRLEISGTAAKSDAGLTLSGSVALREVTASLLDPYLSEGGDIRFSQGTATVSGTGSLTAGAGGAALHLTDGTVTVQDFALQRSGATLLSGKGLNGAGCALDSGNRRSRCGSVVLDQADFADSGFFLQSAGRLRFATNSVEIKNSAAPLQLAGSEALALSDLNMNLSSLPGQVSLDATAGSGKVELRGEAAKSDTGLSLSGTISLKHVAAALLNPYLGDELRLTGSADISGSGSLTSTEDGAVLHFSSGRVALRDFALQHSDAELLSGKTLHSADCSLDGSARRMSCGSVALAQAEFAEAAPGFFFQAKDGLSFTTNTVELSDSAVLLPLGSGAGRPLLPLSGLKMRLSGLGEAQPGQNLQLEAVIGQGSFKAEGSLSRDGSGSAVVTAEQIDLRLFSNAFAGLFRGGLAPSLTQGRLSFQGQFALPESRFTGDFQIDNLAVETSHGESLRWQQAAASNTAVALSPFAASAENIFLKEPSLRLASEYSLPAGLFALLQGLPSVSFAQCNLSNGSVERSDSRFSGIEGSFAPVKAGSTAAFSLTGTMNGGNFAVSGSSGSSEVQIEKLAIEQLPLLNTGKELAQQLSLDGKQGKVSRTVSAESDRLDFSGFVPLPKSDYAFVLALLTDKEGRFSLPLQGLSAAADEAAVSRAVIEQLQRFRLQSLAAPWAALEKLVPQIAQAQTIDFIPGGNLPDFMEGLDSIRALSALRPHLGWAVRGCSDQEADAKQLLEQLRKAGEKELEAENLRRKLELERLLSQETQRQETLNKAGLPIIKDLLPELKARPDLQPLSAPQATLPEHVLPELARVRATVVRDHMVSKLGIPAERVHVEESAVCGAKAEILPRSVW